VNGKWKPEYKAPYYSSKPIAERELPMQDHITYPYLTISDFLEPFIIRLPYPVNKDRYFNGNFQGDKYGYILPLKKEIFQYFSIEQFKGINNDGKKFFELKSQAGNAVEAVLRIPVKKNKYVVFSRIYTLDQNLDGDSLIFEKENRGAIVQYNCGVVIYPFLKTGKDDKADYRVVIIDCDYLDIRAKYNQYHIATYKVTDTKPPEKIIEPASNTRQRSNKKEGSLASSIYHIVNKEFDIVEILPNNLVKGLLVPNMKTYPEGKAKFVFAVDFGTTNTHIEYKIGDSGEPKPFDINEKDMQVGSLLTNNEETKKILNIAADMGAGEGILKLLDLMPIEFIPEKIGSPAEYKFPTRTVINESNFPKQGDARTFADFNIPFNYQKSYIPSGYEVTPNLKWADYKNSDIDKTRLNAFIEKLVMLMKNKVIINGGNLEATEIRWFYPSAMAKTRRDALEKAWHTFAKLHFITNPEHEPNVTKLSESIAPFYYMKKKQSISASHDPVACIDIGGGTTDIVIYKNNNPEHLTSFKFAIDTIFGDGYGGSISRNGFINKYRPLVTNILESNAYFAELLGILNDATSSTEIISFLFSLENQRAFKENNFKFSFSEKLREDEDAKVIFIFFYASIIYHLAKLMKAIGIDEPTYIAFSGTGSKILNIIDINIKLNNLKDYTNLIFSDVYKRKVDKIKLYQSQEPKEITCKGGLYCEKIPASIENIKTVLLGDKSQTLIKGGDLDVDFANNTVDNTSNYSILDQKPEILKSVGEEVDEFITKFFQWHQISDYNSLFSANTTHFESVKRLMRENIMGNLKDGLDQKKIEKNSDDKKIDEPLFFYPIAGSIHYLVENIYDYNP
jgi:hypothetical protein